MNYILIIIYYTIFSTFSTESTKPKLCINCKHFRQDFLSGSQFGKCALFPIIKYYDYSLVNGKDPDIIGYEYCSIMRNYDSYCGKEGKLYEEKRNKFWIFPEITKE